MQGSNTTTLVFLGSCLAFAEAALGTIAGFTEASPSLVAGFALGALIAVLAALVLMYWRGTAFLTLSGRQALDLRSLEAVLENLPSELIPAYLRTLTDRDVREGEPARIAEVEDTPEDEAEEVSMERLGLFPGRGNGET